MKKVLAGALITLTSVLIYKSCATDRQEKAILEENSLLIQHELKQVSRLIVSEGYFSEVYSYKDSKALFGALVTADKKALVVVNTKVQISYDLGELVYELDEDAKVLKLKILPKPEIDINPDFEYYDVSADYFNPFEAGDYNIIKDNVRTSLLQKVNESPLISNAENRLLSELSRIYVLTRSLGWTLTYDGKEITSTEVLFDLGETMID